MKTLEQSASEISNYITIRNAQLALENAAKLTHPNAKNGNAREIYIRTVIENMLIPMKEELGKNSFMQGRNNPLNYKSVDFAQQSIWCAAKRHVASNPPAIGMSESQAIYHTYESLVVKTMIHTKAN